MSYDSHLPILKELTNNLPLMDFVKDRRNSGIVEFDTEKGTTIGFNLFNIDKISVARVFMSKDTVFPSHAHEAKEWIIVYDGELNIVKNNRKVVLKEGDYVYIKSNEEHLCSVLVDTWILCITIPKDEGYPNDRWQ